MSEPDALAGRREAVRAELLAMADDHHHAFWEMSAESQLVYVTAALISKDGVEPDFDELEKSLSDPRIGAAASSLLSEIHEGRAAGK